MMKILLICEPDRVDWYSFLQKSKNVEFELLWFEKKKDDTVDYSLLNFPFSKKYYWEEFSSAKILIRKVNPDKIIFFEILDHRQIATIIAANKYGIPTSFMDHGAAGDKQSALSILDNSQYLKNKIPYYFKRLGKLKRIFSSKLFYIRSLRHLDNFSSYLHFLSIPFKSLIYTNPIKTVSNSKFPERVPKQLIFFSKANYEQFSIQIGNFEDRVVYTGVPYFDEYYENNRIEQDHIIFIDHPYLEDNLLDWTNAFHESIANQLFAFASNNKCHLYIKLHPRSNRSLWEKYKFDNKYISIIQNETNYMKLFLNSKLIIGYSSSLISGFICAKKNIVNIGWHPTPQIFGVNFSKFGLCHCSMDQNDLKTKFSFWVKQNLAIENTSKYNSFLSEFNTPFDGNATQRVIEAILIS